MPISYSPTVDELRYINAGMGAATVAYRLMCESTINVAETLEVPTGLDAIDITEDTARNILSSRLMRFLHKSVLVGIFYATMVMTAIGSATATSTASALQFCGKEVQRFTRTHE